jgi:phospholipid/cholesterol/gamma-HCH transport system permease protein
MNLEPGLNSIASAERLEFAAVGSWTSAHSELLERLVDTAALQVANARSIAINMAGVQALDTLGAWLLERLIRSWRERGHDAAFTSLPKHYRGLLEEVRRLNLQARPLRVRSNPVISTLESLGRTTIGFRGNILAFLEMFGALGVALTRVLLRPLGFRSLRPCITLIVSLGRRYPSSC